jgi:Kef-type K+ transport system membrane component KefB
MWAAFAKITDQDFRSALGRRFEAFIDEAFQVIRWTGMVALADYLARRHPDPWLTIIYWVLAAMLFGYIASRLLLRPEIRFVAPDAPVGLRLAQSAFNFLICIVAFVAVLAAVHAAIDGMVEDRFAA